MPSSLRGRPVDAGALVLLVREPASRFAGGK